MAPDLADWSTQMRQTLARYDELLLRSVAAKLARPRGHWPTEELIDRCLNAVSNPAVLDRRLEDLPPASRQILACIGHSRQPRWPLGNLIELAIALGSTDGLRPILDLLESGLLLPDLAAGPAKLLSFQYWLAHPPSAPCVFAPPLAASRSVGIDLGLPDLSELDQGPSPASRKRGADRLAATATGVQQADGLEWLLRVAVLWQQVSASPLRQTMQGGFFKRDLDRLTQDPLLNAAPPDRIVDIPDPGLLVAALAEALGIVAEVDGELRAAGLPSSWEHGLSAALEQLWAVLPLAKTWNSRDGYRPDSTGGNPFPSAQLLACLLLARLPVDGWTTPAAVETWITEQHPYWTGDALRPSMSRPWVEAFLLGVLYPTRVVEATAAGPGNWRVRLTPLGRWLLGVGEVPELGAVYPQTLLVQPNLEIIAYRQGLTPALIARLTRFAAWKGLGAACTLQLEPESVYRALESGSSFEEIRLTLEQHATRAAPQSVLDALRTWANKRERITVYPSATLLEFASAEDLNEALARGLSAVRVADTLAVAVNEEAIDFRHFRLTGTRDYTLPPERCVRVEADGVTLTVDPTRSDLLLETELPNFAEPAGTAGNNRQYRLTPASLAEARARGWTVTGLEGWFSQRTGEPLPPAARLLLTAAQTEPPQLRRHVVLHLATAELADGLLQWPPTQPLIAERLGPTALVVAEEHIAALRQRLAEAGITLAE
jgi:hypothetical protein